MTFFIIWAIVLGAVLTVAGLVWAIRQIVFWLETRDRLRRWVRTALIVLAATAYISAFIWAGVAL